MGDGTTLLFGLPGVRVARVEMSARGSRVVHVLTDDPTASACPSCGVFSTSVKGNVITRPLDIPYGETGIEVVWHKRRWRCAESGCTRGSFTEQIEQVPARARITGRVRCGIAHAVGDANRSVSEAAASFAVSWPTAHGAFTRVADQVLGEPEPTTVLGIDETRRGKPRFTRQQDTGWWVRTDPWDTGFVDLAGCQGLLGQVEGRTSATVVDWLKARTREFRAGVAFVAIDPAASYAAAVRVPGLLPNATLVVDHFHIVKLANDAVTAVRRRVLRDAEGRRGRGNDPAWANRRRLLTARERLSDKSFRAMWNSVNDSDPTRQILTAWIAKEELRSLLALARVGGTRDQISHRLFRFHDWCANSGIPELITLATTVDTWWPAILAFLHTGITNARTEGTNRLIKQVKRAACGFRNTENSRRRIRFHCTRNHRAATAATRSLPGQL
jgi:transposase